MSCIRISPDTDTYSEYFEDDENKDDRFTDDYQEDFTVKLKTGKVTGSTKGVRRSD